MARGIKMKVLVTGSDGFIGSHLTEELVKKGYQIKAFVYYNSFNNWGWLDTLPKHIMENVEVFQGDIRDPNGVEDAIKGVEAVFHLAALIAIPFSYHSPDTYVDTNIKGTLNVLQAARKLETKRVLVTSTSEVYGTAQYIPIDEKHPFQGQSPYSATKIGADRLAESFYRSFQLPVTIVRPFNYVKDTVNGFVSIYECDKTIGEEINIATQNEISIGELAKELIRQINPNAKIICDEKRLRPEKSEVNRLLGCNEKIMRLTDWKPQYSLEEGLRNTIDFLRQNSDKYKTDIYNL